MTENPIWQGLELIAGEIGVLILNEATATSELATSWAQSLHQSGFTVRVPQLSEHPVSWQSTKSEDLQNWLTTAEQSLAFLKSHCSSVFIIGISMASTVVLRLAELLGEEITGIILLEPSLPKIRFGLRKVWRIIDEDMYLVEQPLILLHANNSPNEYAENAAHISSAVTSALVREIILPNSVNDREIIFAEVSTFIHEVANDFWSIDAVVTDDDLIDAEFESIIAGLALDESLNTNYLDDLDRADPEEHFQEPDPVLEPISDRVKRNSLLAMLLGPVYAIFAAITGFNPFGIEPWPGVLIFIGGLASFLFHLRDGYEDDDGAIL